MAATMRVLIWRGKVDGGYRTYDVPLRAVEILGRTRGNIGWGLFYGLFVVLAAIHGAIGVRSVISDWTTPRGRALDIAMWSFGLVLLMLGARAVYAVVI